MTQINLYRQKITKPDEYPKGEWVRDKRVYWAERLGCEVKHIEFGTVPVEGSTDLHFVIYVDESNVSEDGKKRLEQLSDHPAAYRFSPESHG